MMVPVKQHSRKPCFYEAGLIKRRGRITAKNTVSDYFPVEQNTVIRFFPQCISGMEQ